MQFALLIYERPHDFDRRRDPAEDLSYTGAWQAWHKALLEAGVFVGTVEKDSPAAKAGLQVGDIVTSADGEKVERKKDLVRTIRRKKEGDTVKIELVRDRAAKTLTVTVAEREDSRVRVGDFGPGMRRFHMRHPGGVLPVPPVPPAPPAAPVPPVPPAFQQRLNDLEQRLDALESRVPPKQNF